MKSPGGMSREGFKQETRFLGLRFHGAQAVEKTGFYVER